MMMKIDERKEFTLASPFFDQMRTDLAQYIQRAPKVMEARHAESCSIALKIDIAFDNTTVKDNNAPTGEREAMLPNVTYKLAMTMQAKAQRAGAVVRDGHEIVQDDTGKFFILTKEEASGQLNMFNAHDELPNDDDPLPGEEETEEDDGE